MQIKTDRLLLRELKLTDVDDIQEYATDPQVIKYLTFGPNTEKETRNFIDLCMSHQKETPRRSYELGITLPNENKLIGGCCIRVTDPGNSVENI